MKLIAVLYIINASLLILHEIESAYEKEWEMLKLPGKITGFLLMHVPVLVILFYGMSALEKGLTAGIIIGTVSGICGMLPFLVHKLFVRKEGYFNKFISNAIIYCNMLSGFALLLLSIFS